MFFYHPAQIEYFGNSNRNRNHSRRESEEDSCSCGDYVLYLWYFAVVIFLGFVALIIGIVFLSIGFHDKATTKNLDANFDFKKLSEPCSIVGYNYIKRDQKYARGKATKCVDIYEFYFTVSAHEPSNTTTYVSIYDRVRRDSDSCQYSGEFSPNFNVGDLVNCWRPTSNPSKWYKCGNDDCIKIFSPVSDIERATFIANERYMWGTIVTAVSITVILISIAMYVYLNSRKQRGHQRQFWDSFYASARSRNAEIRSGVTRREYSARPLRERYNASNPNQRDTNIQEATHSERKALILAHLIHKKVLSKSRNKTDLRKKKNNLNELILPHELELSIRQSNRREREANSLKTPSRKDKKQKENKTNLDKKSNILVETLRSIRSTLKISIRTDHDSTTLYSPKTCPICCEDYIKGDDIAWSKNEECCHAFHMECIIPWLMDHEECPMCRSDYICIEHGQK